MKAVAVLQRKSRSDGDTEITLANHRRITAELCERQNYSPTEYYEILSGASALEDRTELLKMLRDIESGLYYAVVVVELQRLARSGHLSQLIADTLEKADCPVITPSQTYNLRDKNHRMMFDILSAVGVHELKTTDGRMRDGYVTKAENKHYVSAQAPFGYDAVWDDPIKRNYRTLVPNKDAEYLQLMFQLADDGYSLRDIAQELDQRGIRSAFGNTWYIRTIQHILNNKAYLGILIVQIKDKYTKKPAKRIATPNSFPALITEEQYSRVQLAVKARTSGDVETRTRSRGNVRTILKDLVFCNICNRKTGFTSSTKRPEVLVVKKCVCGNRGVLEPSLETIFIKELELTELYWREEWDNVVNGKTSTVKSDLVGKLTDLESNRVKHSNRLKRLSDSFLDGLYEKEEFLENKAAITKEMIELDKLIAEVKTQIEESNIDLINSQMNSRFTILEKIRNSNDTKEVNRLLKLIIERIYYQRDDESKERITLMIAPK